MNSSECSTMPPTFVTVFFEHRALSLIFNEDASPFRGVGYILVTYVNLDSHNKQSLVKKKVR